jgi:hypothetical protein
MRTNHSMILTLGFLGACSTQPGLLEGADEAEDMGSDSDSDSSESDGESSESDGETTDDEESSSDGSSGDTELENPCSICQQGELCVGEVDTDVCNLDFGFTISCVPAPDTCTTDALCDPACVEALCGEGTQCVPECNGDPVDVWCGVNDFAGVCDPLAQNCPEGEKCVPIIEIGPNNWDSNKCVPVLGNGQPGDLCMTFDDWSDDCGPRMHCNVKPGDVGNCQLMCMADATCEAGLGCLIANEGVLPICLPTCDPEAPQPCPEGQTCYWDQLPDQWLCVPEGMP